MPCATVICIHVLPRLTPARISRLAGSAEMATRKGMIVRSLDTDVELLARHVSILKVVMKEQPIGIIKLAELTKLPEHKVRYSLRILEREGLVAASASGATTTPRVASFLDDMDEMLAKFKVTVDSLRSGLK